MTAKTYSELYVNYSGENNDRLNKTLRAIVVAASKPDLQQTTTSKMTPIFTGVTWGFNNNDQGAHDAAKAIMASASHPDLSTVLQVSVMSQAFSGYKV